MTVRPSLVVSGEGGPRTVVVVTEAATMTRFKADDQALSKEKASGDEKKEEVPVAKNKGQQGEGDGHGRPHRREDDIHSPMACPRCGQKCVGSYGLQQHKDTSKKCLQYKYWNLGFGWGEAGQRANKEWKKWQSRKATVTGRDGSMAPAEPAVPPRRHKSPSLRRKGRSESPPRPTRAVRSDRSTSSGKRKKTTKKDRSRSKAPSASRPRSSGAEAKKKKAQADEKKKKKDEEEEHQKKKAKYELDRKKQKAYTTRNKKRSRRPPTRTRRRSSRPTRNRRKRRRSRRRRWHHRRRRRRPVQHRKSIRITLTKRWWLLQEPPRLKQRPN